ncbi:MAG TPA: hypothetical protein VN787_00120, partial [Steroidobacteraceae bacterium]|nr:hypothetical protein [Steroidobacteraceae bacterium]
MDFAPSARTTDLMARLIAFMYEHVYPAEAVYDAQLRSLGTNRWQVLPVIEELKIRARAAGL